MESAKIKIPLIVEKYKRLYSSEYSLFVSQLKQERKKHKNKFAEISNDVVIRKFLELPDNLFKLLRNELSDLEFSWIFPQNDPSMEGTKWFSKHFPEFVSPEKI